MDIPIFSSDAIPQPRENVKIELLEVLPYRDRFRVFVHIRVTPFLERPNLLLSVRDADDKLVSEQTVIETMHADMEFTLHLRGISEPAGVYTMTVELFFETRNPPHDQQVEAFIIPEADESAQAE